MKGKVFANKVWDKGIYFTYPGVKIALKLQQCRKKNNNHVWGPNLHIFYRQKWLL
jgi:hypothetical protein